MGEAAYNTSTTSTAVPAPLWEGRYKATLMDPKQYLLICMRYIELNPIRANMVNHPSEYPYSNYACNAAGKQNALITPHKLYKCLGRAAQERQKHYRSLFRTKIDEKTSEEIRESTNKA